MEDRIHQLLDRWLAEAPRQPFMHLPGGRSLSFADLGALTDAAEAELRQLGVRAGDRVLVDGAAGEVWLLSR